MEKLRSNEICIIDGCKVIRTVENFYKTENFWVESDYPYQYLQPFISEFKKLAGIPNFDLHAKLLKLDLTLAEDGTIQLPTYSTCVDIINDLNLRSINKNELFHEIELWIEQIVHEKEEFEKATSLQKWRIILDKNSDMPYLSEFIQYIFSMPITCGFNDIFMKLINERNMPQKHIEQPSLDLIMKEAIIAITACESNWIDFRTKHIRDNFNEAPKISQ